MPWRPGAGPFSDESSEAKDEWANEVRSLEAVEVALRSSALVRAERDR